MFLFKRRPKNAYDPELAQKYQAETHAAARQASISLDKINKVMSNGITLQISKATKGH